VHSDLSERQDEVLVGVVLVQIDVVGAQLLDVECSGVRVLRTGVSSDDPEVVAQVLDMVLLHLDLSCTHDVVRGHVHEDGVDDVPEVFADHLVVKEHKELRQTHVVFVDVESCRVQIPAVLEDDGTSECAEVNGFGIV